MNKYVPFLAAVAMFNRSAQRAEENRRINKAWKKVVGEINADLKGKSLIESSYQDTRLPWLNKR